MEDPRVFFAAERTLLAWTRSGLTLMALGFVVARFSLFLRVIAASSAAAVQGGPAHGLSSALGIALVGFGAVSILGALYNHRSYVRSLPPQDVPKLPLPWLTALLCISLAFMGFVLAAYLAVA